MVDGAVDFRLQTLQISRYLLFTNLIILELIILYLYFDEVFI